MGEMKWTLKLVTIKDIVIRKKKNPYTKNEEEYAVVKVLLEDRFDTFKMAHTRYRQERPICLMCFRPQIFKRLVVGDVFSFGGKTNFPPGNTYHQIKHAFDSLGLDIESEQSAYFAFPSPKPHCTACKYYDSCLLNWQGEDEQACDGFVLFGVEEE